MKNRLSTSKNPALTAQRVEALNAVNLQLLGVNHGKYESDHRERVEGLTDDHYAIVAQAIGSLRHKRGDALAIEPAGFRTDQPRYYAVEELVSFNMPKGTGRDMPRNDRLDARGVFKAARKETRTSNFVYGAALALLNEDPIPVYRADASRAAYRKVVDLLPSLTPDEDARTEMGLYYRNTEMLACLGDIAIGMVESLPPETAKDEVPTLLSVQCPVHTPQLAGLLEQSKVRFQIYPVDSL